MKVGPGYEEGSELTPLIRESHRGRVKDYVDLSESEGATVALDGREPPLEEGFFFGPTIPDTAHGDTRGARPQKRRPRPPARPLGEGFLFGPTILDNVTGDMRVAREEIFGPVLSVVRVDSLKEAVEFTNGSPFGNACSIYTEDGAAVRYWRENVEAGMLGVNVGVAAPMAFFPFNGVKNSFYGDLHATGKDGVRFFTENKVQITRWLSEPGSGPAVRRPMESGA